MTSSESTSISVPSVRVVVNRAIMTAAITNTEPNRAICQDCRGKSFDLNKKGIRSSRRCRRCCGKGSIVVGSTKR